MTTHILKKYSLYHKIPAHLGKMLKETSSQICTSKTAVTLYQTPQMFHQKDKNKPSGLKPGRTRTFLHTHAYEDGVDIAEKRQIFHQKYKRTFWELKSRRTRKKLLSIPAVVFYDNISPKHNRLYFH